MCVIAYSDFIFRLYKSQDFDRNNNSHKYGICLFYEVAPLAFCNKQESLGIHATQQ